MKVCLINPPITLRDRYGSITHEGGGRQAPLGICYIAAVLIRNKIPVSIIDAEAENISINDVIKRLKKFKCDFIGITSTTVAFYKAVELAKKIKKFNKEIFIAIGGPHVSTIPKMTMKHTCFDVGIVGEGECTILELITSLINKENFENIDGLVFQKKGKIIRTNQRKPIENLDDLPYPARELLPDKNLYNPPPMNYQKKPVLSIVTSRGCPNKCTFCNHAVFGYKYRIHSSRRIVQEIKMLIKEYNAKEISIVDDNFTVDNTRVFELCSLIKQDHINIPWTARVSENTVTKKLLKVMKEAGCWYIEIGIESGSQRVLDDIKKETTLEKIADIVKYADKIGISVKGFFIIGYPTDTKESIEQTIKFAKKIPLTDIVTTIFTPFPNTEAFVQAKKHGKLISGRDWTKFNNWEVVSLPGNITKTQLINYWKQMYRGFYFRPIIVWKHLKQIKNWTAVQRYVKGVKILIKTLF
ncbi:MAG: radical SAM protein [Nanoarchaeota archaeon]